MEITHFQITDTHEFSRGAKQQGTTVNLCLLFKQRLSYAWVEKCSNTTFNAQQKAKDAWLDVGAHEGKKRRNHNEQGHWQMLLVFK